MHIHCDCSNIISTLGGKCVEHTIRNLVLFGARLCASAVDVVDRDPTNSSRGFPSLSCLESDGGTGRRCHSDRNLVIIVGTVAVAVS